MVKLPNQPTYVRLLYTALSDLTIALPFISPIAKIEATWGTCTRGLSPLWSEVWGITRVLFTLWGGLWVEAISGEVLCGLCTALSENLFVETGFLF